MPSRSCQCPCALTARRTRRSRQAWHSRPQGSRSCPQECRQRSGTRTGPRSRCRTSRLTPTRRRSPSSATGPVHDPRCSPPTSGSPAASPEARSRRFRPGRNGCACVPGCCSPVAVIEPARGRPRLQPGRPVVGGVDRGRPGQRRDHGPPGRRGARRSRGLRGDRQRPSRSCRSPTSPGCAILRPAVHPDLLISVTDTPLPSQLTGIEGVRVIYLAGLSGDTGGGPADRRGSGDGGPPIQNQKSGRCAIRAATALRS